LVFPSWTYSLLIEPLCKSKPGNLGFRLNSPKVLCKEPPMLENPWYFSSVTSHLLQGSSYEIYYVLVSIRMTLFLILFPKILSNIPISYHPYNIALIQCLVCSVVKYCHSFQLVSLSLVFTPLLTHLPHCQQCAMSKLKSNHIKPF
jgi:hypothetical protein